MRSDTRGGDLVLTDKYRRTGCYGTDKHGSTGEVWYWEAAKYFGGVVKTISEILGERPGSLSLCPLKMLNILPLEANWAFVMKNLTLTAWNMASCFSVALNSVSHRELSARSLTTSEYNEWLEYCVCKIPDVWWILTKNGRSQWPRGLKRRSTAARLLRSWVWIPPGAWMSVCLWMLCVVR